MNAVIELTKPRLTLAVATAAAAGFFAAGGAWERLPLPLLGTSLCTAAAGVFNQLLEAEHDARMERTRRRPLPSGRVSKRFSAWFGGMLAGAGLLCLWPSGPFSVGISITALALYLGVYTPLKKRTPWCMAAGAFAGALPPLLGWSAASGGPGAWKIFAALFAWQLPHFTALAFRWRAQYADAGLRVLSQRNAGGIALSGAIFATLATGGILVGAALLPPAAWFAWERSERSARVLFGGSLLALPALLLAFL